MSFITLEDLKRYRWIAVIEQASSVERIHQRIRREKADPEQVLILSLRYEFLDLLKAKYLQYRFVAFEEIEELRQAFEKANKMVTALGPDFTREAEKSEFFWAILLQWHAEYLLHVQTCFEAVECLITAADGTQTWILGPHRLHNGARFGMFDNCGPVWNLILREALEKKAGCRVLYARPWLDHPRAVRLILRLRLAANAFLLLVSSVLNFLFSMIMRVARVFSGRKKAETSKPGSVLFVLQEISAFANAAQIREELQSRQTGCKELIFQNLGWYDKEKWRTKFKSFWKKCWHLIKHDPGQFVVGRIDPRIPLSHFFFFYLYFSDAVRFTDCLRSLVAIGKEWNACLKITEQLYWKCLRKDQQVVTKGYSRMVLLGYAVEYLACRLMVDAILRSAKPKIVVYPDSYFVPIRIFQWRALKKRYRSLQISHGYYNKTCPAYYFGADVQVAPTELTRRELNRQGIPEKQIAVVSHENFLEKDRGGEEPLSLAASNPAHVVIFYTGYWAHWSYPNQYKELYEASFDLLGRLLSFEPSLQITLKTHPNGSSAEFFEGLRFRFQDAFDSGKVELVTKKWASENDYRNIDLAVSLTQPSSPFLLCLKYEIPLLIVSAYSQYKPDQLFNRTCNNIEDYPFLVQNVSEACERAQEILTCPETFRTSREKIRGYVESVFSSSKHQTFWKVLERMLEGKGRAVGEESIKEDLVYANA